MTDSASHNLNVINQLVEELGAESVPSTLVCNVHPLMILDDVFWEKFFFAMEGLYQHRHYEKGTAA